MANKALPGAGVAIRVDKSADFGVVVAGLQVVEAGFGVVVIASVSQRVDLREIDPLR